MDQERYESGTSFLVCKYSTIQWIALYNEKWRIIVAGRLSRHGRAQGP